MIADRLGRFEYEISHSLGPQVADIVIKRLRRLEEALTTEFDIIDKKIENAKKK